MIESTDKLLRHKLLEKVNEGRTSDLTTLKGYVGPAEKKGFVRIYSSLEDLGESVEVAEDDIVHHESVTQAGLPDGAVMLWLKPETKVSVRRERSKEAIGVSRYLKEEELVRGRVRIVIPGGGLQSQVCQSVCKVCQSVCKVCQSVCSATIGNFAFRERFWR